MEDYRYITFNNDLYIMLCQKMGYIISVKIENTDMYCGYIC